MKSQLDDLMHERELDAFIVAGGEEFNSARHYLTKGAHITGGVIFKLRGREALLICHGMEMQEAKKSGLELRSFEELGYRDMLVDAKGDSYAATVKLWAQVLSELGLEGGRVSLYGAWQINQAIALSDKLRNELPQYEFVAEARNTLMEAAMLTKDADEIARLKAVAADANAAMACAWDFIADLTPDGEFLCDAAGERVTIGDVKALVRRELMARGLEDTGMIFAQGRDAAFPHSRGESDMPLRLGQTIVFDLFPRELGGGYHHDMTRTWCIGHAPAEAQEAYDMVMEAFDIAVESFGLNKPAHLMGDAVLDYFESKNLPTSRSQPKAMDGYTHSLGHGVGIDIHERPSLSHIQRDDKLQVGNVLSIEPGLYFPERGFGVRVEDLFVVDENGELVSLTPFRKDLVIPLKGG